jgi:predicted RNA-binding Zn-ribbon protein involved in translation (DUF1610 family)
MKFHGFTRPWVSSQATNGAAGHPLIPPDILHMVTQFVGPEATAQQRLEAMAEVTKLVTALQPATQKRKSERRSQACKPSKKAASIDDATAAKYSALAKEFGRCTACGWLIRGQDKAVHVASPDCKPELFGRRIHCG